jgi:anti-sigma regulatory factor (Ser/Thr protein kinase)/transposase-like protein
MTPAFRKQVLQAVARDGRNVAARLAKRHKVSRQAASAWLARLREEGVLAAHGVGRGVAYELVPAVRETRRYARAGLQEDRVWLETFAPRLSDLPTNVRDTWHYGITEMVNNAIDHSGSAQVAVGLRRDALDTTAWIADEGEGIFLKIQRALKLYDPREAILELAKGKLTTDPARHTGEGIFFASKVMDAFEIRSGRLHFLQSEWAEDMLLERPADAPGTLVLMRLANDSRRTLKEVFDRFAAPEEYTFDKTIVPVRLALYEGEKLMSRSQAKRLTQRFERFRTVVLDFSGVAEIGQAFADEVFRVFQAAHPGTKLVPTEMTPAVRRMVKRARAGA